MLFVPIGLVSILFNMVMVSLLLTTILDTELIRSDDIDNPFGAFINKCPKTPISVVVDAALQCIDDSSLSGIYNDDMMSTMTYVFGNRNNITLLARWCPSARCNSASIKLCQ